jgi:hypothetical protein
MREIFSFLVSVLIITSVWILFTWQRLQVVWLENRICEGLQTIRELEDTKRSFTLRRAALRSLARVTHRAENELGMAVVDKDRLIVLDGSWDNRP